MTTSERARDDEIIEQARLQYENSFYEFFQAGWPYIDPAPFRYGQPIEAVAEHLEAVCQGDIKRLIINLPPRMSKSSLCAVSFPAWVWSRRQFDVTSGPGVKFLHASYSQALSLRDSVKCRRLIESPWYQRMWGNRFRLTSDQNTKTRFDNDHNGSRLSTSVGSSLTGEGGNCFVSGTLVGTPLGPCPIENLGVGSEVLAFDHLQGKVVKSKVIAAQSRLSEVWYEVHTTSGNRFVCTGNHPIFSPGRGYIRADQLGVGDRVLVEGRSLESICENGEGHSREGWSLLRGLRDARQADPSLARQEKVSVADPSSGREHSPQYSGESDHSLHIMPHETPCWDVAEISGIKIHRGEPVRVHDIQVEKFSNFFAEGVLAHNCIIVDDPNAAQEAYSEATIASTIDWWDTALSTRLNDPVNGAFVIIQQRLAMNDLTGHILEKSIGDWTHLVLPMRYEAARSFHTIIGWKDWRTTEGELLWPERFSEEAVGQLERTLGTAAAGQLQQRPIAKGGEIIKREWWRLWEAPSFPPMDYILASLDTAYTTKQENDFSALTIWGVFSGDTKTMAPNFVDHTGAMTRMASRIMNDEKPARVMLMNAWQERLEFPDLVRKVLKSCKDMKVDKLIIENKAAGISVSQELRRLLGSGSFAIQLYDPKNLDKVSRVHAIAHFFSEGLIYAPDRSWADMVITQMEEFPRGVHDDLCFVADTQITMSDGSMKRIDEIVAGDVVRTPNGPCIVSASGLTGIRPIWRVDFTGGYLEGTGEHPVYVDGIWKTISSLRPRDTLTSYQQGGIKWGLDRKPGRLSKALNLMGINIIDTRKALIQRIVGILDEPGTGFIGMFGSILTGLSRRATRSITLMGTLPIMRSVTLNVCPSSNIGTNISANTLRVQKSQNSLSVWQKCGNWQRHGTKAQKDESGIVNTYSNQCGRLARLSHIVKANIMAFANGAVAPLRRKAHQKCFAAQYVQESDLSMREVFSARFTRISRPVYNLTVEGAHCYYANGVLVHNCDTVSQSLRHMRDTGLLVRPDERLEEIYESQLFHGSEPPPLYPV